ncbi:MAG: hypothetical protein O7G83_04570 [Proteobacteria bacterium]|nr:hypothetical protein [Pseudomonadota bacterium]
MLRGLICPLFVMGILMLGGPAQADYYDGLRAFDAKQFKAAFVEWKAAADAGDDKSQVRLAGLYEEGRGVPQNYVQAHLYFNLAAAVAAKYGVVRFCVADPASAGSASDRSTPLLASKFYQPTENMMFYSENSGSKPVLNIS